MSDNTVGVAFVRISGRTYPIAGDCRMNPLTEKRTPLVGMDGNVAQQVEFQSPMVEFSIRDRRTIDLLSVTKLEHQTITVELGNDTMWELTNGFYAGDGEFDAREGTFQCRFHGDSMKRVA
jgi:hypothetical protein